MKILLTAPVPAEHQHLLADAEASASLMWQCNDVCQTLMCGVIARGIVFGAEDASYSKWQPRDIEDAAFVEIFRQAIEKATVKLRECGVEVLIAKTISKVELAQANYCPYCADLDDEGVEAVYPLVNAIKVQEYLDGLTLLHAEERGWWPDLNRIKLIEIEQEEIAGVVEKDDLEKSLMDEAILRDLESLSHSPGVAPLD